MKVHAYWRRTLTAILLLLPTLVWSAAPGPTLQTLRLRGTEIALTIFPAQGHTLLLWLPSESGIVAADHKAAAALARAGIEVWLPDLHAAYFLPVVGSSIRQIPVADVASLIAHARQRAKAVYLVTSGNGAPLALQAAAQLRNNKSRPAGAVLFSPNLYTGTPAPGEDATYSPITTRTRLPIFIVQPDRSPWKWRVDELKSRLQQGGSRVKVQTLPEVRDRFYYRDDASPVERAWAPRVPELILGAMKNLKETR